MNKRFITLMVITLGMMLVLAACSPATEAPTPTKAPVTTKAAAAPTAAKATVKAADTLKGDALRGGRLYDSWITESGAKAPAAANAIWTASPISATVTASISKSWRCSTCHGWDFKGANNFVEISASAGKDATAILAVLKGTPDAKHDFSSVMDNQALTDLALFVSGQQIDTAALLALPGKADHGKTLFGENCIDCHGPEGLAINFSADNTPLYPAVFAQGARNLELLAKLRFGQPGVKEMPSLVDVGLKNQDYADLIAFLKTLPVASPSNEGGRMYDSWYGAIAKDGPKEDQPLWKKQTASTTTGASTWRCATCHGWDYKGVTVFPGILNDAKMSAADLTAWLDGTKNADHNFSTLISKDDMGRLVAFIQKDVFDKSTIIKADKTVVGGDAAHGKKLYVSGCKYCHGDDGKLINFKDDKTPEYIGNIATGNPMQFFNRASDGVPGKRMPSGWNLGFSRQDVVDLLTYAQTLPTK